MIANDATSSPRRRRRQKLIVDVKIGPTSTDHWTLADALLADLQTTQALSGDDCDPTGNMYYQQESRQTSYTDRYRQPSPTPPPLPPLPSQDILNTVHATSNGLYRERSPSNCQIYSSTITVSKTIYDQDAVSGRQERVSSSVSPRLQVSPRSTLDRHSTGLASSPSLVSGNLSELDTLLDDLNVSTKMYSTSTMERRAAGRSGHSPSPRDTALRASSSTPVSTTPRSSSVQRELEIPKLATMQRSTPSPSSLSPRFPDQFDGSRSSPLLQTGSLNRQRPLVQPAADRQFQQETLVKVYQQPAVFPSQSLHTNGGGALLNHGSTMHQGMASQGPSPQQPVVNSYREQQIISNQQQMPPASAMTSNYTGAQSLTVSPQTDLSVQSSSPSSQFSGKSGQRVRVLDGSGQDVQVQVHAGFDGIEEQISASQSAAPTQSRPTGERQTASATNAYSDLEDIMAAMSEFDKASANSSHSAANAVYTQPQKAKSSSSASGSSGPSQGVGSTSSQKAYERGLQMLSPGVDTQDSQPSPSAYRRQMPQPTEIGSSRPVMSNNQLGAGAGRAGAMHGQLGGFDENGLPLVAKGDCGACGQPITGQVLMALDTIWHVEHFLCAHCNRQLGTDVFYENEGQPYCERDYQELFLPKCADCHSAIADKCVSAFGKNYHLEHFRCAECNAAFGDDRYYEKDGKAYCSEDYFKMYAPKCGGCGKPIMSSFITAVHQNWHVDCFVCFECHLPFDGSGFYELNGAMYCERHFLAHRGVTCATCGQPVRGRCVTAMYKKYHPEHFVCTFCLRPLNQGTFKENSDKPYCHVCFDKLFG